MLDFQISKYDNRGVFRTLQKHLRHSVFETLLDNLQSSKYIYENVKKYWRWAIWRNHKRKNNITLRTMIFFSRLFLFSKQTVLSFCLNWLPVKMRRNSYCSTQFPLSKKTTLVALLFYELLYQNYSSKKTFWKISFIFQCTFFKLWITTFN